MTIEGYHRFCIMFVRGGVGEGYSVATCTYRCPYILHHIYLHQGGYVLDTILLCLVDWFVSQQDYAAGLCKKYSTDGTGAMKESIKLLCVYGQRGRAGIFLTLPLTLQLVFFAIFTNFPGTNAWLLGKKKSIIFRRLIYLIEFEGNIGSLVEVHFMCALNFYLYYSFHLMFFFPNWAV